ncbi:hypothetical protein D3C80_1467900 [compost metagenome]
MGDVMHGMGGDWKITAGKLVFALGTGFDALQPLGKGEVYGLMIADFEMQEGMILDTAPVTAVERITTDKIDRAGDITTIASCHDQQNVIGHAAAYQRIEATGQIWSAPFAAAGIHVESEELIPDILGQVGAGQPVDRNSILQCGAAFLFQRLALA